MATSGTTSFSLPLDELIEQAAEWVGGDKILGKETRTVRRALNLLFVDMQNRGVLLHTLDMIQVCVTSSVTSFTLSTDTLEMMDVMWRSTNSAAETTDYTLNRISFSEYLMLANKGKSAARPTQYFLDRKRDAPVFYMWPVPDDPGAILYWKVRFLEDAGSFQNTPDVPRRYFTAMVFGLSYYIGLGRGFKVPADRLLFLKTEYEKTLADAMSEDRERVNLRIVPSFRRR